MVGLLISLEAAAAGAVPLFRRLVAQRGEALSLQ
jgi:hypothetical protein